MDSFDWEQYLLNYPDLKKFTTKQQAWNHYQKYGIAEGRTDIGNYKNHPFYTHQPILTEVLKMTTGNILECGCGLGSTLLIKKLKGERKLVSLESNEEWLNKFTYLEDESHKLYKVPATNDDTLENANIWVETIKNLNTTFDVIFIDSSPWLSRKVVYNYFKEKGKIMIIHDFDYFPNNGIIGRTTSKTFIDGREKITCEINDINFRLFYPPDQFFPGATGPPTLLATTQEFDFNLIESNIKNYYL
jgi:hypothetical protein